MDKRKNCNDRRHKENAQWDSIMAEVAKSRAAIDNFESHFKEMKETHLKWARMTTTKG